MESTTKQNSYARLLSQADTVVTSYDGTDATQTIYTLADADFSSMLNGNFMVVQALPSSSLQSGNYVNEGAYFGDTNQPQPDNPDALDNPYPGVRMAGIYFDSPAQANTTSISEGESGVAAGGWRRGRLAASPPVSDMDFTVPGNTNESLNDSPVDSQGRTPGYRLQGYGMNVPAQRCFVTNPFGTQSSNVIARHEHSAIQMTVNDSNDPATSTFGLPFASANTNILDITAPNAGVLSFIITAGGNNWNVGQICETTTAGGGTGLRFKVVEVSRFNSELVSAVPINVGSDYAVGDLVDITHPVPGPGDDATIRITSVSTLGASYGGDLSGVHIHPTSRGRQPQLVVGGSNTLDGYVFQPETGGASNGLIFADFRNSNGRWEPDIPVGGYTIVFGNRYRPFTILTNVEGVSNIQYIRSVDGGAYTSAFTFEGPPPGLQAQLVGLPYSGDGGPFNFCLGNPVGFGPTLLNNNDGERNMGTIGTGSLSYSEANQLYTFTVNKPMNETELTYESIRGPLLIDFGRYNRNRFILHLGDEPIQNHSLSVGDFSMGNADRLHKVIWGTRAQDSPREDKSAILSIVPTPGATLSPLTLICTSPIDPITGRPIPQYSENSYVNILPSMTQIFEIDSDGNYVAGYGNSLLLAGAGSNTELPSIKILVQWIGFWGKIFFTPVDLETWPW
jgi:hypothetical protein